MGCLLALIILYFLGEYQGVWEADGVGMDFCRPWVRPLVPDLILWGPDRSLVGLAESEEEAGEAEGPLVEEI